MKNREIKVDEEDLRVYEILMKKNTASLSFIKVALDNDASPESVKEFYQKGLVNFAKNKIMYNIFIILMANKYNETTDTVENKILYPQFVFSH